MVSAITKATTETVRSGLLCVHVYSILLHRYVHVHVYVHVHLLYYTIHVHVQYRSDAT